MLLLAFVAGFLSFFSPCIFVIVPSFFTYLAGVSLQQLTEGGENIRRRVFRQTAAFVAGFSMMFILFGLSANALGRLFLMHQTLLRQIGGIIVVLFGLHLTGKLPIKFLLREKRLPFPKHVGGLLASFGVGIAFSTGWTPCVGPVLTAILVYAGTRGSTGIAVLLLGAYALGLGIPFLTAAWFSEPFLKKMGGFNRYLPQVSLILGILLILFGILLLMGSLPKFGGSALFTDLEEWLLQK